MSDEKFLRVFNRSEKFFMSSYQNIKDTNGIPSIKEVFIINKRYNMERQFFFNDDEDEREFLLDNKNLICELIITAIKKSMREGVDIMEVFTSINSNKGYIMTTQVKKEHWDESLEKCLEYFIAGENYEWCDKIKQLKIDIENGDTETD
jgi:hypothetical protein